jgi:type II secretory pathway pseudopilin PulG
MHIPTKRPALSLVELLIVVAVIGILTALVVTNALSARVAARDASRKQTVTTYVGAMEQWRTISPEKSFFVRLLTAPCVTTSPGNDYMRGTGAGCVGYNGGGAGRMTRTGTGQANGYAAISIVEALRAGGVLSSAETDPSARTADTGDLAVRDYILTTCQTNGQAATTVTNAQEYAVYAMLENPSATGGTNNAELGDQRNADRSCGGPATGFGWQIDK